MKQLIEHVQVFDGEHSKILENRSIVIEDNLVKAIETGEVSREGFDRVIDGKCQYAIPGLTDAHVHLGRTHIPDASLDYDIAVSTVIAKKLLQHGITTVRDAGGITQGLKKAIDTGVIDGPRIFPSNSYISQTSGHGDSAQAHAFRDIQYRVPSHVALADGPAEVYRAVREQFYKGASQIKIMAGGGMSSKHDPIDTIQFSDAEMRAAVEAAADYGTYVMAHLYSSPCMQRAVKAGIKSLEHAHAMDEETAKMISDNGVFVDPMPQFTQKEIEWNHMKVSKNGGKGAHIKAQMEATTERILKYDLKILFGTDLMIMYPGYEPRESLDFTEYKKRFGSLKGLLAATGNVHELIRLTTYQNPYPEGEIGVLKAGSYADLLLTKGNPAEDLDVLGNTDNLLFIMKNGVIYKNTLEGGSI